MLYSFDYDTTYDPALPVVQISVWSFGRTAPSLNRIALVDSGADVTMFPLNVLREIGARKTEQVNVCGVSGVRYVADIYKITMRIGLYEIFRWCVSSPTAKIGKRLWGEIC